MKRKIVSINEEKCNGCGLCVAACHEGALQLINGKAKLISETYCDGLGDCLPECPAGAITIEGREVAAYDENESQLRQWPCQIKLVPVNAPYLENAQLLIAADCTAYAYADLHRDFMRNKITLIGCPKLDAVDYAEKLTAILQAHEIKNITILRMEVPCCGGLVNAVKTAMLNSGKMIPWQIVTIRTNGEPAEGNK